MFAEPSECLYTPTPSRERTWSRAVVVLSSLAAEDRRGLVMMSVSLEPV